MTGRLKLVAGPSVEPIDLARAKAHLRVDFDDDDALIAALITAARQHLDGPDGLLGRALCQQQWDLALDAFPRCGSSIVVPLPPLQAVDSISYVDAAGDTQTLASAAYQVVGAGESGRARIFEAYGTSWPATRCQPGAVTVRFTAGYDPSDTSPADHAANVPEPIKAAMLLAVGDLYENRETMGPDRLRQLPWFGALVTPYRLSWL